MLESKGTPMPMDKDFRNFLRLGIVADMRE